MNILNKFMGIFVLTVKENPKVLRHCACKCMLCSEQFQQSVSHNPVYPMNCVIDQNTQRFVLRVSWDMLLKRGRFYI